MPTELSLISGYSTLMVLSEHEHFKELLPFINVLAKRLDILKVINWHECNDGSHHKGVRESTRPTGTWRSFGQGIDPESATGTPYSEPTGQLAGISKIDVSQLRQKRHGGAIRARLIGQYMAGMLSTFVSDIFYGDRSVDGIRPWGITNRSRFNTLSSDYVYDNTDGKASATQNKTSMYLMGFGDEKISCIYPTKDAPMQNTTIPDPDVSGLGVRYKDYGDIITQDADGKDFPAFVGWLEMHFGFDPADYRYLRRVANISMTNVDGVDDFSINENFLIRAMNDMPDMDNAYWFANRQMRADLRIRVNEKGNLFHTMDAPFGKNVMAIDGIPILLVEDIISTEETVS